MFRRISLSIGTAMLAVLVFASISQGQATVGKFYNQGTESGSTALPECLPPELVGTLELTHTEYGHFTALESGFHVEGTEIEAYRVDFPDGRYVLGVATSHFNFNTTDNAATTFTTVIQEPRTIYNADDEAIGTVFIHALSHITYRDTNGNGLPDDGEITASVDRFFFTCG